MEDYLHSFSVKLLTIYVSLSVSHLGLQFLFACLHHLRAQENRRWSDALAVAGGAGIETPSISVIYPIYFESVDVLGEVIDRARRCLRIPNLEIIFVDDGSPNREELRPLYDSLEDPRLRVINQNNGGKRNAQRTGFDVARGEFIVTVDSDTLIEPEGVLCIIAPMLENHEIGAVTGDVRVANAKVNLLTRLIDLRYWIAFHLERAAQSYFGSVLCCSGPFSAYRREVIHAVRDRYTSQRFMGQTCTYGDDRHLTNLTLALGYKTVFQPFASAMTHVPENLGEYARQQTRWNKSFFREILWTLRACPNVSLYSLWDMLVQPILFALVFLVLGRLFAILVSTGDLEFLGGYLLLLLAMASLRAVYGLLRTGSVKFGWFLLYGALHIGMLLPLRLKALLTLSDGSWGTRLRRPTGTFRSIASWFAAYYSVVAVISMTLLVLGGGVGNSDSGRQAGLLLLGSSEFQGAVGIVWRPALALFASLSILFMLGSAHEPTRGGRRKPIG